MEQKDLIKEEIYKSSNGHIFKYKDEVSDKNLVLTRNNNYDKSGATINLGLESPFSIPTSEEKHWLNECIKADEFIPKEEAMKSFNQVKVLDKNDELLNVGDIFVFINTEYRNKPNCDGDLCKITKITNDNYHTYWISHENNSFSGGGFGYDKYIPNIRKATSEETEAYNNGIRNIKDINKEFVLPEKWCVKVTKENRKVLSKWRESGEIGCMSEKEFSPGYIYSPKGFWSSYLNEDYTEITFEQFKQYVLKEEVKESNMEDLLEIARKKYPIGIDPYIKEVKLISLEDEPILFDIPKSVKSIETKLVIIEE